MLTELLALFHGFADYKLLYLFFICVVLDHILGVIISVWIGEVKCVKIRQGLLGFLVYFCAFAFSWLLPQILGATGVVFAGWVQYMIFKIEAVSILRNLAVLIILINPESKESDYSRSMLNLMAETESNSISDYLTKISKKD